jgi:hypothetical protein
MQNLGFKRAIALQIQLVLLLLLLSLAKKYSIKFVSEANYDTFFQTDTKESMHYLGPEQYCHVLRG